MEGKLAWISKLQMPLMQQFHYQEFMPILAHVLSDNAYVRLFVMVILTAKDVQTLQCPS